MNASSLQRLFVGCVVLFLLIVAAIVFLIPHLPNQFYWNIGACCLGVLVLIVIYLILRPTALLSSRHRRWCDAFIVGSVLVAIPGTVCMLWLGTSDWSRHPSVLWANLMWAAIVMVGCFIWFRNDPATMKP